MKGKLSAETLLIIGAVVIVAIFYYKKQQAAKKMKNGEKDAPDNSKTDTADNDDNKTGTGDGSGSRGSGGSDGDSGGGRHFITIPVAPVFVRRKIEAEIDEFNQRNNTDMGTVSDRSSDSLTNNDSEKANFSAVPVVKSVNKATYFASSARAAVLPATNNFFGK